MKIAIFALLLFSTNWTIKSQTEIVVEPGQTPALIPIENQHTGDSVRVDISSVSPIRFAVVASINDLTRGTCFRDRVTNATAECTLPSDTSAIAVWDMRAIRIRTNKVIVRLSTAN